ncbi:dUTP diphosphatase [Patescibacteria group bacterium]|nr:dUTP diphosphatase [Patescibacteria group bacterium]
MDTLKYLLESQKAFEIFFIDFNRLENLEYLQAQIKNYVLALDVELAEFLSEINWKPWKKEQKELDFDKLKEELIDILHFFLILCLLLGLDADEIKSIYDKKMLLNIKRQQNNY